MCTLEGVGHLQKHARRDLLPVEHLIELEEATVEGDGEERRMSGIEGAERQLHTRDIAHIQQHGLRGMRTSALHE